MRRLFLGGMLLLPIAQQADAAGPDRWTLRGSLARSCVIDYDCGGNDRCNSLRLDDTSASQDVAELSISCNFTSTGVSLEFTSQNSGAMISARDPVPLEYDLSMGGMEGGDFSDRSLSVPVRVLVPVGTPGHTQTGLMRVRIRPRRETLAADRYSDRIVVTILPESQ